MESDIQYELDVQNADQAVHENLIFERDLQNYTGTLIWFKARCILRLILVSKQN